MGPEIRMLAFAEQSQAEPGGADECKSDDGLEYAGDDPEAGRINAEQDRTGQSG